MISSRRSFLQGAALSAASLAMGQSGRTLADSIDSSLRLLAAGYPYDHVKAFMTGQAEVEGCMTEFEVDKIGNLNNHIFAGPQTRCISEVGLAPFMLAYANDSFRD